MARVDSAYGAYAFHRVLVANVAAQRITGVRRIYGNAAVSNDFDRVPDQTRLRIFGMYGKQLWHGKRFELTAEVASISCGHDQPLSTSQT